MKLWIVQANSRDHGGEVVLLTTSENKARDLCRELLIEWNADDNALRDDADSLSRDTFLDRYMNAWSCSPILDSVTLDERRDL